MLQIQRSIGFGSLGQVFADVKPGELHSLIEKAAAEHGYTADVVHAKLLAGGTLWLNRVTDDKIRGFDADAHAAAVAARAAAKSRRQSSDGYFNRY